MAKKIGETKSGKNKTRYKQFTILINNQTKFTQDILIRVVSFHNQVILRDIGFYKIAQQKI